MFPHGLGKRACIPVYVADLHLERRECILRAQRPDTSVQDVSAGGSLPAGSILSASSIVWASILIQMVEERARRALGGIRAVGSQQAPGGWSGTLYVLYTVSPLAGIIDNFQNTMLRGCPPDF